MTDKKGGWNDGLREGAFAVVHDYIIMNFHLAQAYLVIKKLGKQTYSNKRVNFIGEENVRKLKGIQCPEYIRIGQCCVSTRTSTKGYHYNSTVYNFYTQDDKEFFQNQTEKFKNLYPRHPKNETGYNKSDKNKQIAELLKENVDIEKLDEDFNRSILLKSEPNFEDIFD